jgi:hypothetical protein
MASCFWYAFSFCSASLNLSPKDSAAAAAGALILIINSSNKYYDYVLYWLL